MWNKFLPWANTTTQLELDKLEKDWEMKKKLLYTISFFI
ncbi:hypothetical protein BFO_3234 [Tannerella forsythia 92A2]|uniref:Uncharacterized protein n=1 Tax=Tannerella forsythia (strain ATCC 43037 / JCM 10827 / CCUG 21028 A / KCTC 5666 / FDC 338) TaxID=203275 RepID=G8UI69_TANFA|nr:hypothetical protein BFO_3234 [Tannerella forsythia 92A2]